MISSGVPESDFLRSLQKYRIAKYNPDSAEGK